MSTPEIVETVAPDGGGPHYLNQAQAALQLGLARATLSKLAHRHPLYAPAYAGIPGAGANNLGTQTVRYHQDQLLLIEAVLLGKKDLEEAWLEWRVRRGRLGEPAPVDARALTTQELLAELARRLEHEGKR